MKKLNFEYFHFGNDNLYKELWLNIYMNENNRNYTKPMGGLWTSEIDARFLCEWLRYKYSTDYLNFDLYVANKGGCLVKFKEDAKLLSIETQNDFKNLKDSGFIIELEKPIELSTYYDSKIIKEIPNYELISQYYDLIYIDNFVHECFTQFSIETMLALNPESIEYYKTVQADFYNFKEYNISEKKYMSEPNKEYFDFLIYVKDLFSEIKAESYEEFIAKLTKLKNNIIEDLRKNFDFTKLNLPKDININNFISTVVINTFNKKNIEAKKVLVK